MYSLFVGIDVSKDSFSVAGLNDKAKVLFSLCPDMNAQGFSELLRILKTHESDLSSIVVALESTGPYHLNLFSFLVSKGIYTIVVNPLIISNFTKLSLRKTKTDKKDAVTIARFLFLNRDSISQLPSSQGTTDLEGSRKGKRIYYEDDCFNEERCQKAPPVHLSRTGETR